MAITQHSTYVASDLRHKSPCECTECQTCELYDSLAYLEEDSWFLTQELLSGFIDLREAAEGLPTITI